MTTTELINSVLLRHPHIKLAVLFGPLAAGTARPDSDLDLAVADDKPLSADARIALIADLAEHVGRPVDLIDLARAWSTAWCRSRRGPGGVDGLFS